MFIEAFVIIAKAENKADVLQQVNGYPNSGATILWNTTQQQRGGNY